jgi:hypothetical protein
MSDRDDRMSDAPPLEATAMESRAAYERGKAEMRDADMPDFDFDRIEKQLMARVDAESRRRRVRARGVTAVAALALAAAAVLVAGRTPSVDAGGERSTASNGSSNEIGAGALESGVVTSSGRTLAKGDTLHRGDHIETAHAIVRSPGRVVYSLDGANGPANVPADVPADVTVSETDRPIVLSLASGVVEAQVDKVPSGEAFAVDLLDQGGSGNDVVRIAVHGTHLRVAREGKHVVLDLTEGIVNVGHPPKTGSTYGTLVTAPAHVELDIDALETSFTMTKDPARVLAANDLSRVEQVSLANDPQKLAIEPAHVTPASKPLVITPAVAQQDPTHAREVAPAPQAAVVATVAPAAIPAAAPVDPNTAAVNAVTQCARDNIAAPMNGKLTIMTQMNLRVGDDGNVQATRFEPPLPPAVQDCAAKAFKSINFAQPGPVLIPITIER